MAAVHHSSRRILTCSQRSTHRMDRGMEIRALVCPPMPGNDFLYGRFSRCVLAATQSLCPFDANQNPSGVASQLFGLVGYTRGVEHLCRISHASSAPGGGLALENSRLGRDMHRSADAFLSTSARRAVGMEAACESLFCVLVEHVAQGNFPGFEDRAAAVDCALRIYRSDPTGTVGSIQRHCGGRGSGPRIARNATPRLF
jgi:hypothetical protein